MTKRRAPLNPWEHAYPSFEMDNGSQKIFKKKKKHYLS